MNGERPRERRVRVVPVQAPEKTPEELECVTPQTGYDLLRGLASGFGGSLVGGAVGGPGGFALGFVAGIVTYLTGGLFENPAVKFIAELVGWEGPTKAKAICRFVSTAAGAAGGAYLGSLFVFTSAPAGTAAPGGPAPTPPSGPTGPAPLPVN